MDASLTADEALAHIAASMAEPVRARMLCCLMDGHARTATELAAVGEVAASTASAHLARLLTQGLVACLAQGRHRYYRLADDTVGQALEALLVVAGQTRPSFEPSTPMALREARRCYDHLAGQWGVRLHDHALSRGWMTPQEDKPGGYRILPAGLQAWQALGVNLEAAQHGRRRPACACMDWSERRPHLGGALGALWLQALLSQGWLEPALDSRALTVTRRGRTRFHQLLETS